MLPSDECRMPNIPTPPPGFEPGTIRLTAGSATTTPRGNNRANANQRPENLIDRESPVLQPPIVNYYLSIALHTADRDRTRDLWVEARCVAITPLPRKHVSHTEPQRLKAMQPGRETQMTRGLTRSPYHLIKIGAEGIAPPSRWLQHRANLSQLNPSSLQRTYGRRGSNPRSSR